MKKNLFVFLMACLVAFMFTFAVTGCKKEAAPQTPVVEENKDATETAVEVQKEEVKKEEVKKEEPKKKASILDKAKKTIKK